MKSRNIVALILVSALAVGIGANPRFIEELRIGGGFGDTADGGADFEKDGDIFTDGNITAASFSGSGAALVNVPPSDHAPSHVDGSDDIQDSTVSQKGLMTAAQAAKLDGVEAGADVTTTARVEAAFPVGDSGFLLHDDADITKQLRLELAGLGTSTSRVWTVPDQDLDLAPGQSFQAHDAGLDDIAGLASTKGTVLVGDGSNWVSLAVGANGQQLEADSTQSLGLRWSAAGGAGDTLPVDDTKSVVRDPVDTTRQMRIDVGAVATGTTRDLIMPDQTVDLTPDAGTFNSALKRNLSATSAPGTADDAGAGYGVGSLWVDVSADKSYACVDSTAAAAVWVETSAAGGGGSLPVEDTTSIAEGSADATKELRFEVDGFTAGATRVITPPDQDLDMTPGSGDLAWLGTASEFTAAQNFNATSLTDAANISWDTGSNQVTGVTLAGNRTLDNPTNLSDGATYILTVKQDATGGRTLSYGSAYKWPGGTAPTLTGVALSVDILIFISDGTNMYGSFLFDLK